jgi:hypothetical protein
VTNDIHIKWPLLLRVTIGIHIGCLLPLTGWRCILRPNSEGGDRDSDWLHWWFARRTVRSVASCLLYVDGEELCAGDTCMGGTAARPNRAFCHADDDVTGMGGTAARLQAACRSSLPSNHETSQWSVLALHRYLT